MYRGRGGELDGRLAGAAEARRRGDPQAEAEYERLFLLKVQLITEQGGEAAAEIRTLAREVIRGAAQEREIDDALAAGRAARDVLMEAQRALDGARFAASWDVVRSILLFRDIERPKMSAAVSWLSVASEGVARFQSVIQPMDLPMKMELEIELRALFRDIGPFIARGAAAHEGQIETCRGSLACTVRLIGRMLSVFGSRRRRLTEELGASRERLRREVESLR